MTEPPDYAALARQYLDLWEEHLTALANHPNLATQTAAMFGLMGQMMPPAMPGADAGGADPLAMLRAAMAQMTAGAARPAATPEGGTRDDRSRSAAGRPGSPAGAAAAAAAPGDGDERLDELARRLAAVEERLAELGAGGDDGARRPEAPARKTPKIRMTTRSNTPSKARSRAVLRHSPPASAPIATTPTGAR